MVPTFVNMCLSFMCYLPPAVSGKRGECSDTVIHASCSSTDKILPAGSLNHAIFGPPPRKIPFRLSPGRLHGRTRTARHVWQVRLQLAQCCDRKIQDGEGGWSVEG